MVGCTDEGEPNDDDTYTQRELHQWWESGQGTDVIYRFQQNYPDLAKLADFLPKVREADVRAAAAVGVNGRRRNGIGRKTKKSRGPERRLTAPQEAMVAAIEDHKLSVPDIAKTRGCTHQAVYQLYARAKRNPGYKKRRSVNLSAAKPLHSNTRPKSDRVDDE